MPKIKPAEKIRIGDVVEHRRQWPGFYGRVWELRSSGRASIHWFDHDAKSRSFNKVHVKLSNLRKVKP